MPLTVQAPEGFHFDMEEVKTKGGKQSLGEVPILVCDSIDALVERYTEDGVKNIIDGTSLRVSMQGIGRRMKAAGKSDDEIATAQLEFRPGKRAVGQSTPESRARRAAATAAEKTGNAEGVAELLAKIASGEIPLEAALGAGASA